MLALKNQLNGLTGQLSTGQVAQTYGGLGTGRSTALGAQATLSALTGYAAGITAAKTRTDLAVTSLTQVASLGTSTRTVLDNGLQSTPINTTASTSTAVANLSAALDALTQSAAGNYLFGGKNVATQPVLGSDAILNGTTDGTGQALAGLKTLIGEQVQADVGSKGLGRLTQTSPGQTTPAAAKLGTNQISLTDDTYAGSTAQFGYALTGAATGTGSFLTPAYVSATANTPSSTTLSLTSQPNVGDSVTLNLRLPDGTSTTLTLTAATSADAASTTSFTIGSDLPTTTNNLSQALTRALTTSAGSTLTANATARASQNFFAASASAGTTPNRITTDPTTGRPTGYVTGAASKTIVWYQGESDPSGTSDPRATQSVQVSATSTIKVGARANELPIQNVLAGLATAAFGMSSTSNVNAGTTYQAVASKSNSLLASADTSPSVQDIVTTLSLASAGLANAATTNTATQNTIQNTLDGIEQAPTEEVAAKLLELQTRLQASYQITSSLSKLSLVNYIS
ncbi:flagellin [Methylobacterium sp. SI9]|uniref:flagellin n=1 Tax=Methylobacterium guangdongense TaxID=3138811 RepID=UPI00313D15EE